MQGDRRNVFRGRRRVGGAASLLLALPGCFAPPVEMADTRSEIAAAVRAEYRKFVAESGPDLGPRVVDPDGRITAPPSGTAEVDPEMRPAVVESLPPAVGRAERLWAEAMTRPMFDAQPVALTVTDIIDRSLARSNQLAAVADLPLIRDTVVRAAEGRYDPELFAEVEGGVSDRVRSNTLETGAGPNAPETLEEDFITGRVGLRQRLLTGGDVTVSQSVGRRSSNSEFFVPDPQSGAGWRVEITQPLLQGAGVKVNSAPIQLAMLERDQSVAELRRTVDTQIIEAVRAYWALYEERGRAALRARLASELRDVVRRVRGRAALDALPSEVRQAEAASSRADAAIVRSRSGVRNAEARLTALLSDPSLFGERIEILPAQPPTRAFADVPLETVAGLALTYRPEIHAAALQLRAAEIRRSVAENGLDPRLDAFARVGNDGLTGSGVGRAASEQFGQTDTDFSVGLRLRLPIGRIAERAEFDRRRLEERQLASQLRNVADTVLLEAQIGVREARTAFEEVGARETELAAVEAQAAALAARDAAGAEAGSAFLAAYLSAIEQRAAARERLLEAIVAYNLALYTLERVAGTLAAERDVQAARASSDTLDFMVLTRGPAAAAGTDAGPDVFADPPAVGRSLTDAARRAR